MKPRLMTLLLASSMVLFAGCSSMSKPGDKASTTPSSETAEINKSATEAHRDTTKTSETQTTERGELYNSIDVEVANGRITATYDEADAGPVSFNIHNGSGEPLDVVVLKTDLPASQIPIKEGKIDLSNQSVTEVGHLSTSPIAVNGEETIIHTLEPGNYLLMAYAPGHIDTAMHHKITVQRPGV